MKNNQYQTAASILYILFIALFITHSLFLSGIAEDSHITFRFAQNWAAGYGPLWNFSEAPVEGYTNFLWVAVSALIIYLDWDLFSVVTIIGISASLITIELTRKFSLNYLGCNKLIALVPCLFLALSGPMATWASSGMETNIFGLMLFSACYNFAGYWREQKQSQLNFAFIFILLATLLRPEGLMVFCLMIGMSVILSMNQVKRTALNHFLPVAFYVVPFSLYFIWRLDFFGDPLPNTFYAKTGGGIDQYLRGGQYIANFSAYYLVPLMVPMLLAYVKLGLPKWQGSLTIDLLHQFVLKHSALFICFVILAVYLTYILYVGGDYMAMYRFLVPLLPLLYVFVVPVIQAVWVSESESHKNYQPLILSIVLAALLTGIHSTPIEEELFPQPGRQHGHYRGVVTERWHVARLSLIGQYFNNIKKDSSESLATRAIGAIAYYADMEIHDISGLTDTNISHKKMKGMGKGWAGHEKMDIDYSFRRLSTYFMFDRMLVKEPEGLPIKGDQKIDMAQLIRTNYPRAKRFADWIERNPEFIGKHYDLKTVWMDDTANNERGYFSYLQLKTSIQ